eukprot:14451391-Ditylum_brightwellii.AAC.1
MLQPSETFQLPQNAPAKKGSLPAKTGFKGCSGILDEMEEMEECFVGSIHQGICRDDGLVVFVGKRNKQDIQQWLQKYQHLVNELAEGDYLQFTTELWKPLPTNNVNSTVPNDKKGTGITVVHK